MAEDSMVIDGRASEAKALVPPKNGDGPANPFTPKPSKKGPKPPDKGNGEGPKLHKPEKGAKPPVAPPKKAAPRGDAPAKGGKGDKGAKTPQKGDKAKGEKSPKPEKKASTPAEPGSRGMVGFIVELVCSHTEKKPISRGQLFDKLKKEFPEKTESQIDAWIGYFPGYVKQAGHTIHTSGRGADRTYWGEKNTHEPGGRRFGNAKKRQVAKKPAKKVKAAK